MSVEPEFKPGHTHDPRLRAKLVNRAEQIINDPGFMSMQPDTIARRLWAGWTLRARTAGDDQPVWVFRRPEAAGPRDSDAARWAVLISFSTSLPARLTRAQREDGVWAMVDHTSTSGPDLVALCQRLAQPSPGMRLTASVLLRRLLGDPEIAVPELHDPGFRLLVGLNADVVDVVGPIAV